MIETMSPEGWERVRAVRLRALLDTPDAFGRMHSEEVGRAPELWRERLAHSDAVTFLAVRAGRDVGIVSVAPYVGRPGCAGLFSMWAEPEARGSGVATALVESAIDWARSRGFESIVLDVGDHNARAIAFYGRMGFEPTGATGTLPEPRTHILEHERARTL
jgi:GNAT superfamily N-acetyltransferase